MVVMLSVSSAPSGWLHVRSVPSTSLFFCDSREISIGFSDTGPQRLRNHRSSDHREALEELPQVAPAPRPKAPSPVPELHTRGVNTLVLDRPSKPEALGAFAAGNTGVPKESRSGDLGKLQEIIDRLQTENAHLKSHIVALTPQAKSAGEAAPEDRPDPPAPPLPEKPGMEESDATAAEAAGDMPEAPAPLPEQEAEATAEESHAKAEQPAGDMPEAPPPPPERETEATAEDCIDHEGAGNMRPEAPPLPEKDAMMEELQQMKGVKIVQNGTEEPQKAPPKANVRPKQVNRPRPRPDELLKQAGIPLTPEAMLKQLLSPPKSNKVMLPRTELAPEDPDEIAMQRQEAMTHLLRVQLGRPRDEGSELDGRSRELSPSPKDLDVDATQEQAMKGALHSLFRSFGQ
eukprot:s700_g15.t1